MLNERVDYTRSSTPETPLALAQCAPAVERATSFDSVPDDLTMTMSARGCEFMDGALEAVERARPFGSDHLERLVVIVSADVALRHQAVSIAEDRI